MLIYVTYIYIYIYIYIYQEIISFSNLNQFILIWHKLTNEMKKIEYFIINNVKMQLKSPGYHLCVEHFNEYNARIVIANTSKKNAFI